MSWQIESKLQQGAFSFELALESTSERVAIIGPNGSGKSTLLRVMLGAAPAQHFRLGARVLDDATTHVPTEQRRIGFVPQGQHLFAHLDVRDNVAFGLRPALGKREARERAERMLATMECAPLARRRVTHLSAGEAQRVALARALITQPDLLLLDEPFAPLDPVARRAMRELLVEKANTPLVLVTHDVRDVRRLGAHVVVLDGGKVVQRGELDELIAAPANDYVAEFVAI